MRAVGLAVRCKYVRTKRTKRTKSPSGCCGRRKDSIHTYINPMHFDFVQEDLDIYFAWHWKQEFQHGSDALGPGGFCVFRTFCLDVSEVLA